MISVVILSIIIIKIFEGAQFFFQNPIVPKKITRELIAVLFCLFMWILKSGSYCAIWARPRRNMTNRGGSIRNLGWLFHNEPAATSYGLPTNRNVAAPFLLSFVVFLTSRQI